MRDYWKKMLGMAGDISYDFRGKLEALGEGEFASLKERILKIFPSNEKMTDAEWLMATWRYLGAVADRDFNPREIDKLHRWAFHLCWWKDRLTEDFSAMTMRGDKDSKEDPVVAEIASAHEEADKLLEEIDKFYFYVKPLVVEHWATDVDKQYPPLLKIIKKILSLIGKIKPRVEAMSRELQTTRVDRNTFSNLHKNMTEVNKQIAEIEQELGINVDRGRDSVGEWVSKTLSKVERYMKEHPLEFTWKCPQCRWEGILHMKRPEEGSQLNAMELGWHWKCPACGQINACDVKHPLFDGRVLWSKRGWELVEQGQLSLVGLAYILETSPEYPLYAAQNYYHKEIPEHVKKEFEEYERSNTLDSDEGEVSDDVSLSEVAEEDDTEGE